MVLFHLDNNAKPHFLEHKEDAIQIVIELHAEMEEYKEINNAMMVTKLILIIVITIVK